MSHRGSTLVPIANPYGVGMGPRARHRLSLRGLGEDTTDYGLAARQAALDSARQDRLQRMYEEQDAAKRAAERQQTLQITQEAVRKARGAQADILISGQNQLRRLLLAGSGIAIFALGAITLSSVMGGRRRGDRAVRRSRRSKKSRRSTAKSSRRPASWRPTWKPRASASPAVSPVGVVS